jgi:hypothetical protein
MRAQSGQDRRRPLCCRSRSIQGTCGMC